MITLSKVEIGWIIDALQETIGKNRQLADDKDVVPVFREIFNLHAENLSAIVEKLTKAYENDHKRIAIK